MKVDINIYIFKDMNNKIIAFTLFGQDIKYYVGAQKNVNLINKLLPDWEIKIYYHDKNLNKDFINLINDLKCTLINVDIFQDLFKKDLSDFPIPYFWRFISFFDDNISIVRDLDSRISEREVKYIQRWLDNGKPYFVIRDHPWHSQYPAGLFGIKGNTKDFKNFMIDYINKKDDLRWGDDQHILDEFMLEVNKDEIEYCGYDRSETYIRRENPDFFIGIQLDENDKPTELGGVLGINHLKSMNL